MKKICYGLSTLLILTLVSCGVFKHNATDTLYTHHNRNKVKIKDGLFSSAHASFGPFATSKIENGVNTNIVSFKTQERPFHFTFTKEDADTRKVEAVYTNKESFDRNNLPETFSHSAAQKIFYAWISGSSTSTLKNWELIVKNPSYTELANNSVVGVLRATNEVLYIHANNRSGTSNSYDELCYEFQLKGIPVAAVQVNGRRKYVWMRTSLNDEMQSAVAGAMAALLLKK